MKHITIETSEDRLNLLMKNLPIWINHMKQYESPITGYKPSYELGYVDYNNTYHTAYIPDVINQLEKLKSNNQLTVENASNIPYMKYSLKGNCKECDRMVDKLYQFHYDYDREDCTISICEDCLKKALNL